MRTYIGIHMHIHKRMCMCIHVIQHLRANAQTTHTVRELANTQTSWQMHMCVCMCVRALTRGIDVVDVDRKITTHDVYIYMYRYICIFIFISVSI